MQYDGWCWGKRNGNGWYRRGGMPNYIEGLMRYGCNDTIKKINANSQKKKEMEMSAWLTEKNCRCVIDWWFRKIVNNNIISLLSLSYCRRHRHRHHVVVIVDIPIRTPHKQLENDRTHVYILEWWSRNHPGKNPNQIGFHLVKLSCLTTGRYYQERTARGVS